VALMARNAKDISTAPQPSGLDPDTLRDRLPAPVRYVLAVCLVALAFSLRFVGLPIDAGAQFLTFFPAVALSFYLLGMGPGVVALILSALLGYCFFFPPYMSFRGTGTSIVSTVLFVLSSAAIAYVLERMYAYSRSTIQSEKEHFALALRERDKRFELAVDGARLGMYKWDVEDNSVMISGACCVHFGLPADVREISYEKFLQLIHSGDRRMLIDTHAEAIRTHEDFEVDYRVTRPDHSERWLTAIGRPYFSREGLVKHVDGVVIDISKRKELERQLQQLNNDLEIKVRERTTALTRANETLAEINRHDSLTGLSNRLAASEMLRSEYARMARTKNSYAVLMLDVDFFKKVNDTYGHAVGDEVLRLVSSVIKSNLRVNDFVSRFGGEEFLVLLPSTGLEQAIQVAEKIRSSIAAAQHPTAGRITVSIGVAVASPDQTGEEDAVKVADDRLYEAKNSGRDRVCAGEPAAISLPSS
jgi:diguanylate cyclase (GGDEF)-like protein/PAS domain S-box-containing protein